MVKGLTLRSLTVLAGAFAVSGLVTMTVGNLGLPLGVLPQTTMPLVDGDLPNVAIETADGTHLRFAATAGRVRIATMIYSHCPGVCPMTIQTLQGIEGQLTAAQRQRLGVVLLSMDPTRDTPRALRSLARERQIQSPLWILGRTSESDARAFASAAHIQYRPLSDGSIDHSTALVLLDARGQVIARTSDAGDSSEFVEAVRRALHR